MNVESYKETENALYDIWNNDPVIEYVYVYQIRKDGCHVVFDLDTPGVPAAKLGEVVDFDESFEPYLPQLLKAHRTYCYGRYIRMAPYRL